MEGSARSEATATSGSSHKPAAARVCGTEPWGMGVGAFVVAAAYPDLHRAVRGAPLQSPGSSRASAPGSVAHQ